MLVKKTKRGKFSFTVTCADRSAICTAFMAFLEQETKTVQHSELNNEYAVMQRLYYSIINDLSVRIDFQLHMNAPIKWTITRAEALAMMWLLRNHDQNMQMLDLKVSLHKQLQ